ncbi:uncharacterized protein [Typha latifolia]|uniref:uncharacterized protein isoform X1 n=2 Tax=Typha latifolia TaxID=4733 RepID=UPI003C2DD0CE
MHVSFQDGKKLWSLMWHKEDVLDKKRRWLQSTYANSDGNQTRPKRPKFLTNMHIPHSELRSDEVSYENVRINVEKCFGSFHWKHHLVQDYLHLFDMHIMESDSQDKSNFLKAFSSKVDDLNNNALCSVANIVTNNNVSFEKTRPRMKKIMKDYLPDFFQHLNSSTGPMLMHQLSQIFSSPCNFRDKPLRLLTPVTPSLLSSIHNMLERLEEMTSQELVAINRKLRGVAVVPQFPPVHSSYNKDFLMERVRRRCNKFVSALKEGIDLPKELAKALSVMLLSLKQKLRCVDISMSEFFPFSPDILGVQNDILKALWSLSQVKPEELNLLHPQLDPNAKVPRKTFRKVLRKYLMEYLFECDEINITDEAQSALAFINRRSRRRPRMFAKETREEEVEAVLNMSCQLKIVIASLFPDHKKEEECAIAYLPALGSDSESGINDFEVCENSYAFKSSECQHQQVYGSCSNDLVEATGDSKPASSASTTINGTLPSDLPVASRFIIGQHNDIKAFDSCPQESKDIYPRDALRRIESRRGMTHEALNDVVTNVTKKPRLEYDVHIKGFNCPDESEDLHPQNDPRSNRNSEIVVQEVCDETALFAHRLIGLMLDKFLQVEGREVDALTSFYLRDGSSSAVDLQANEGSLNVSKENIMGQILIHAVDDVAPSLSKSIERVKKLMELP